MSDFLFVLQYDSFIRNLMPVVRELENRNHRCDLYLLKKPLETQWISSNILQLLEGHPYETGPLKGVLRSMKQDYPVMIIGSVGGRFIKHMARFRNRRQLRTRIASGYIGALLDNYPKGFIRGVTRRAETEFIWVPGNEAVDKIIDTGLVDPKNTRIIATGLPVFDHLYRQSRENWKRSEDIILFIEQPTFPKPREDRVKLVSMLIQLAQSFPEKEVVIKPRFNRKTGHAHRPKFLLPDILEKHENIPPNIRVSYGHLHELFRDTYFAVTISSTGGMESLLLGIPTYFIDDFCGDENLYGTNYFRTTGGVVHLDQLLHRQFTRMNVDAVHAKMRFDGKNCERMANAFERLQQDNLY